MDAKLELGDAVNLQLDDNSLDFIVARGILAFTLDDQKVVDEIRSVLKPGD